LLQLLFIKNHERNLNPNMNLNTTRIENNVSMIGFLNDIE